MAFAAEPDPDPRRERAARLLDRLSAGERAVALLVGRGRTNSEIGQELLMSTATVKAYMSRILTKLASTTGCRWRSWCTTPGCQVRRNS
jgi:DNA-binding NarL/FixJ family response regulator